MFRLIPPAATPISFGDLYRIITLRLSHHFHEDSDISAQLRHLSGANHIYYLNSGRACLQVALRALSSIAAPDKDEVVIPAYTCFSVAASIVKSNLKIRLVDIDPYTMDFDYGQLENLDFSRVLSLIGCNMFGILNDWERLRAIAKKQNIFLIDDAAQSMGVNSDGLSRVNGDIGFYSLGRGKNLSAYSGGILVTKRDDLAAPIDEMISKMRGQGTIQDFSFLMKIILYAIFVKPRLYWIPSSLPFIHLGETIFDPEFGVDLLGKSQKRTLAIMLKKLEQFNSIRGENSARLASGILRSSRFTIPGHCINKSRVYLRLPVLFPDGIFREQVRNNLRTKDISASPMYPSTIRQIPGIEKHLADRDTLFPGAQSVVERILCLPTHPYLTDFDIDNIISCFR